MKSTIITCASCGQQAIKKLAEINRQIKKGKTKFYCNLTCAGKVNVSHLKPYGKINSYKLNPANRKDDYTDFKWYIKNIIKNSKKKKQFYDIDLQYLKDLWELQHGICPITGCKLTLRTHNYKQTRGPYQASLDRIDNKKGYIKGNVRFVALMFNYARNIFTDDEVIEFCKTVTNNYANRLIDQ